MKKPTTITNGSRLLDLAAGKSEAAALGGGAAALLTGPREPLRSEALILPQGGQPQPANSGWARGWFGTDLSDSAQG